LLSWRLSNNVKAQGNSLGRLPSPRRRDIHKQPPRGHAPRDAVRVELSVRTISNILGPSANPAGVRCQLIGVHSLGTSCGPRRLAGGKVTQFVVKPEDAGLSKCLWPHLGATPEENAAMTCALPLGDRSPGRRPSTPYTSPDFSEPSALSVCRDIGSAWRAKYRRATLVATWQQFANRFAIAAVQRACCQALAGQLDWGTEWTGQVGRARVPCVDQPTPSRSIKSRGTAFCDSAGFGSFHRRTIL